ncbi:MAG: ROK family glucokinase [Oscillospiraceae bacterium]
MFRVGVDLGGTNISVGVIDDNLEIIGRAVLKTNLPRSSDKIFEDIAKAVKIATVDANITMQDISTVGVGTPGAVNTETGIVEFSSNLKFFNAPLKQTLQNLLNKPVFVTNDANCAALAEKKVGAGKGAIDFIAITLGTGIGGGIFVNDKMLTGVNGAAVETGHMVIDFDGVQCGCGRKGCWEKYASATAIKRQTLNALFEDKSQSSYIWELIGYDLSKVNAKIAFDAMRNGDKLGVELVERYLDYLACGITNLINLYQPQVLCIGGGMSNEGNAILLPVIKRVEKERYSIHSSKQTEICIAKLKNDAGIIGAALLNEI